MIKQFFLFVMLTGVMLNVLIAQGETDQLTLERLFNSREFIPQRFGPAKWLPDGNRYTTLEESTTLPGSKDIVAYRADGGDGERLVTAEMLIPEAGSIPLSIENYSWSPNLEYCLIYTNSKRVWRRNTRGDYWLINLASKELRQLGGDLPSSSLMFAKFSPDGEAIAFVSGNNIYVEGVGDGRIRQLTEDGSETIINGTFDWVYEEEFGLRDGFRWSPDSKRIAYWQLDAEGVGIFNMINNTDSIYSKIIPVQYPKVGTTNSACRVGVVELSAIQTQWLNIPGDPRNHYIAWMEWAANSEEVSIQQYNRRQDTCLVMLGDAVSGVSRVIYSDTETTWLDLVEDMRWLGSGRKFLWVSEKEGWRQLYLVDRDGREERITDNTFDIISIVKIDEAKGWVYYLASPDDATTRYLYRTQLRANGRSERLTPPSEKGMHTYQISPTGDWAISSWSSTQQVPVTRLLQLPGHKLGAMLVDNTELMEKYAALAINEQDFFQITGSNGVVFDGWRILPPDFDAAAAYPTIFYVYGEPAAQTVLNRWGNLWHHYLAQQGFIVISIDNRGTPAPRGREWRKSVHKFNGTIGPVDQAAALEALLEAWPFVDANRIGVWGWSGGGSSTLHLMFKYPEYYHTGISVAPVSDLKLYDTIYEERYSGLPWENEQGYFTGSPINYAENLQGNLLIMHGTGDDNVHYQNVEVLINELVAHNKQFDLMIYPNRTHSIRSPRGTRLHLYTTMWQYWKTELMPMGESK
jgi:dipeptidyl-peptidase-4